MEHHIQLNLNKYCNLQRERPLIVGVSGGADSLCLMTILKKLDFSIIVVHMNHSLRAEADQEENRVAAICEKLDVPFITTKVITTQYAHRRQIGIEEAARKLRYQFLFEQAEKFTAQAVAVAHTANDQVETILMHLLRGSGLDGLSGMQYRSIPNNWSDTIPLIRPLLSVWREEIEAYLAENQLEPNVDPSNQDSRYYRNRLRNQVIPYLKTVSPEIQKLIWQTGELLAEDKKYFEALTHRAWENVVPGSTKNTIQFRLDELDSQPLSIKRRLLRKGVQLLRPELRNLDYAAIQRMLEATRCRGTGRVDVVDGLVWIVEEGFGWLTAEETDLPRAHWPQVFSQLTLENLQSWSSQLNDGWGIRMEVLEYTPDVYRQVLGNQNFFEAWLDAGQVKPPIIIRSRLPGDRYHPMNLKGHSRKLADLMIDQKLPARIRPNWPLVCDAEHILWLPGFHPAINCQVTEETRSIIHLTVSQG